MDIDSMLKKYGVKYEDLNAVERESFNNMLASMQQNQLTLEKLKEHLEGMRDSLINEVSNYANGSKQDLFVKARLRNYTLLLAFMQTPEKAKKAFERALAGVK